MTNLFIITNNAIEQGVFTEEEVKEYLEMGFRLPLHTFAEWKRLGYSVKKGEKARMMCYIWRYKGGEPKDTEEINTDENGYYKVKAYFFTKEQVQGAA